MSSDTAIIREWNTNVVFAVDQTIYTSTDPDLGVAYQRKFYKCLVAHTAFAFVSDFGNGYWEEMTVRGIKGDQGLEGDVGPTGLTGATGDDGANGADGADGAFTLVASVAEAQAGTENTKVMTALRVQDKFDFEMPVRDATVATNTVNITANTSSIGTNTADIAAINIDSAQITTNANDIVGLKAQDIILQSNIDAVVVDTVQVGINQSDINTINTVEIPRLDVRIDDNYSRISALENNFQLSVASGKQELLNNQLVPVKILGLDYGAGGSGNRWELNNQAATSATIRAEIYRKDDVEARLTVAMLEMHFLEDTSTWYLGRTWTTAFSGLPEGVEFTVNTVNPAVGIYVGEVSYVSDDMVGGNYSADSYVKFLLDEISSHRFF